MNSKQAGHVCSIQSHVVSGYVGNKCATFPLQLLGFEVDAVNSVQLSNHTGYKVIKGQVLTDEDLGMDQLVEGLVANELDNYTHLLTGYVGSASFLRRVGQFAKMLKQKNPNLIYVCDPVMGDNGKLYVPEELKDIYRDDIVPLADIVTPNDFELKLLTGKECRTMADLQSAIKKLHEKGPKTVVVSSANIDNKLVAVASTIGKKMLKIEIPKIQATYTGSGDLFAALFLAHYYLQDDIKSAFEKTVNTLHDVLLNTLEHSKVLNNNTHRARNIELRLIQSKHFIENPKIRFFAEDL
ncbi:pyridoxal kinase isoform X2 [Orussus abietinus]|uniref:pyridoxal kinase isoform X2 n=1 Tax=Orussus abietinus TaxID=222816 RepID=UPI0006268D6D|nr:pyridoxal kinase isoform X2 [Orussus abietinus]